MKNKFCLRVGITSLLFIISYAQGRNIVANRPVCSANVNFLLLTLSESFFSGPGASTTNVPTTPVITTKTNTGVFGSVTLETGEYSTYVWKKGDVVIGTDRTVSIVETGLYTVTVTAAGVAGTAVSAPFSYNNYSYVISNTILKPGVTNSDDVSALTVESVSQIIQYFDGLGRPMQTVSTKASPEYNDVVQPVVYDGYGREYRKYLPVTVAEQGRPGWYKPNLIDANGNYTGTSANFYNNATDDVADDARPYAETVFESSPLNRPERIGQPGETWYPNIDPTHNHSIHKLYEMNGENDVLEFFYNTDTNVLTTGDYYPSNKLYANGTVDEQGNQVVEYVDNDGKTVLKRVQYGVEVSTNNILFAETYYIYDDFDKLIIVLPPEAIKEIKERNGL
ncbi:DUF6443 domain-containing protein [Chryseolinea lacunae]|uniref:DUF6443 domain-containing protein n=1 Tax=Chryseolinea lacunae TaxID=2801331 RepID=A0ABS1KPJ4_9BACT|nr:DUF6443 domain-containing protein [Chryseolinea lacunae]MBL0741393.1 hypothetical protein [Chryseolinea lacunae]